MAMKKKAGAVFEAWSDFDVLKQRENTHHVRILFAAAILGSLGSILIQTLGTRLDSYYSTWMLLVVIVLGGAFQLVTKEMNPDRGTISPVNGTLMLYIWSCIFTFTAVLGDTLFTPKSPCFISLFYLTYLPLMIIDSPLRVGIVDGILTAFACFLCVLSKSGGMLEGDILHLLLIFFTSMTLCSARIRHIHMMIDLNQNAMSSAEHDKLTGIYNRRGGESAIRSAVENHVCGTFMILDVDNFKHVNDSFGHARGDRVLRDVATLLRNHFRSTDVVMRMGGDEFIVYSIGNVYYESVRKKMNLIHEEAHRIMIDEGAKEHVTVTMGCVINDGTYPDYESLFQTADRILYEQKDRGKDSYQVLSASYKV